MSFKYSLMTIVIQTPPPSVFSVCALIHTGTPEIQWRSENDHVPSITTKGRIKEITLYIYYFIHGVRRGRLVLTKEGSYIGLGQGRSNRQSAPTNSYNLEWGPKKKLKITDSWRTSSRPPPQKMAIDAKPWASHLGCVT